MGELKRRKRRQKKVKGSFCFSKLKRNLAIEGDEMRSPFFSSYSAQAIPNPGTTCGKLLLLFPVSFLFLPSSVSNVIIFIIIIITIIINFQCEITR